MLRSATLLACSGVVSVLWLTPRAAQAEPVGTPGVGRSAADPSPTNPLPPARKLVLALGIEVAFGGDVEEQRGVDIIGISGTASFGWNVSARYRVAGPVALGVRGSWAAEWGDRDYASNSGEKGSYERSLWQSTVEGRYQPGDRRGWYAAVRAGAALIIDSEGSYAAFQGGPLGAVALGYDISLASAFSLGLELQGSLASFPENGAGYTAGEDGESSRFVYGTNSWLGFGLVGSLGI